MIVILSGPPAIGKTELVKGLLKRQPLLATRIVAIPLYNSRQMFEKDVEGEKWYFRSRGFIERMTSEGRMISFPMRSLNLIAVDPYEVAKAAMKEGAVVLVRVMAATGNRLALHPALKGIRVRSIFLSPYSLEQLNMFKARCSGSTDRLKEEIIAALRENLSQRMYLVNTISKDAKQFMKYDIYGFYEEMREAPFFEHILVNPEVLGGDQWLADTMKEDSARVLEDFTAICLDGTPKHSEQWPPHIFTGESREEQIRHNFRPRGITWD